MKKRMLLMIFLILGIVIILGCSSTKSNTRDRKEFGRGLNLTEEERQQMFEEMQQIATEACQDRNEGDDCVFETPRGEMNGICKILDKNLVCTTNMPAR